VRTGTNTDAKLEVIVDRLVCVVGAGLIPVGFHQKRLGLGPVDAEFNLLRLGQPFDVLVAVASEADLELVDGVLREGVSECRTTASAERQPLEVILLREVGRVPFEQCRR
jgi:hypothetical protein